MKPPATDPSAARFYAVILVLFFGTLLLFSRAVPHEFLDLDDPDYVTQNPHVQAGLTLAGVRWAFTTDAAGNWHPLTWLSHLLDWQLFGNDPRGPHAVNVFWHALDAVLAFLALRRLTGAFWTSAASAALFAWHPLRVESVAWIAERKDVLSVFFGLLTLWAYARYAEGVASDRSQVAGTKTVAPGPVLSRVACHVSPFYCLTLAAFAAGLMCKPMLVTLPFLLLLLDFWPLQRFTFDASRFTFQRLVREKIPLFLLSAVSCLLTYLAQKQGGAIVGTAAFGDRLDNALVSVAAYLGKFFWPFNLAIGYPRPAHWPAPVAAGATLLVLALSALAFWQWRRRPWLLVGWFWFLGLLVPVIGLVQVGLQSMADRYTCLPILGLQLALLWTLREVTLPPAALWLRPVAVALVLAACAARTWNQLAVWQNPHTLYAHALAVSPDSYLAHDYLGTTLLGEGRNAEAESHFRRAIELKPDYVVAHRRLGLTLEKLDRENDALAVYEALLKFQPGDAETQFRCANVLARLDRDAEALPHYERAVQLRPDFEPAQCHYADSLRAVNRLDDACARYRRAIQLQPDDAGAHFGLGVALEDLGRTDEALASYRRAVALKPAFADAQYNTGVLLLNRDQPADAAAHFQSAIESRTNYAGAYVGLGLAEEKLNRLPEAVEHLEQARQLDPDLPGLAEALAQARAALKAGGNEK
jgi:tetratricopeptide (TPR) repeat protein